jgi:hypothetical protein
VVACVVLAACSNQTPWTYNTPPAALGSDDVSPAPADAGTVVVIGDFGNPATATVRWRDIGTGVSGTLSQSLRNEGEFDVWSNEKLAKSVRQVLDGPTEERIGRLGVIHDLHPEVRLVVVGRVTDFHHTSEMPAEVRRRSLLGTRREAIVAIQLDVVDLERRRILVSDHIYGASGTGSRPSSEVYAGVTFGSYLFWSSPLGRATEEAIDKSMTRIRDIVPLAVDSVRIVRQIAPRKIALAGASGAAIRPGQEFFVCRFEPGVSGIRPVLDVDTGEPLRARVLAVRQDGAVAWLCGEKPVGVSLRGAELRAERPAAWTQPLEVADAAD